MAEQEHGTRAGFMRHKRAGEEPCEPCCLADREYHRERRQRSKPARAAEAAPAELEWIDSPPGTIRFLTVVQISTTSPRTFGLEVWSLDENNQERWLLWGAREDLVGGPLLRVLELLQAFQVKVVIAPHRELVNWTRAEQRFGEALQQAGAKAFHVDDDSLDRRAALASIQSAYTNGKVHLPEGDEIEYVARKRKQVEGGGGLDAILAEWVAQISLPAIPYTARMFKEREESDREQATPRRRVQGAIVSRGRMFPDMNRFVTPEQEYEVIPVDHPALRRESWIGVIPSEKNPKVRRRTLDRCLTPKKIQTYYSW